MQTVTSLLAYVVGHVGSFKNTERSSWKSQASTLCSFFLFRHFLRIEWYENMIMTYDSLFVAQNVTRGSGRKT